jgi:UDP-N-acetylmuramate dehydrogenase
MADADFGFDFGALGVILDWLKMVEQLSVSGNYPMATLVSVFGPNLELARELAPMTSYKTGGRAKYFLAATSAEELVKAVTGAKRLQLPYFLVGGGSNLLVSDSGFDGIVIKVDVRGFDLPDDHHIKTGAGEDLMSLVNFATEHGLTGLEFAAGIWGSVGGAIYGNAGAFGGEIGTIVTEVELVDLEGNVKTIGPEYCCFGYRHSYLKLSREVVVSAVLRLEKSDRNQIQAKVDAILAQRNEKHPNKGMSAGCFFKNIPDPSQPYGKLAAGKLLDEAGVKGLTVGGAAVYEKHANIIVNTGTATSKDIRRLADMMKQRVLDKFGIELEEEVIQVGTF